MWAHKLARYASAVQRQAANIDLLNELCVTALLTDLPSLIVAAWNASARCYGTVCKARVRQCHCRMSAARPASLTLRGASQSVFCACIASAFLTVSRTSMNRAAQCV